MGIVIFIIILVASYYGLRRPAGRPIAQISAAQSEREGNIAAAANGI